MLLLERSKITVSERHFFKKKVCYGSFGFVSTLRKKIFSVARMKCFSHYGSNNSNSAVFGNAILGETKDHNLRTTSFLKNNFYGSFRYMSTLRKKVFSGAPVKFVFLYGSNNSNSVVFGNANFAEIKDHSLRTTPFQK